MLIIVLVVLLVPEKIGATSTTNGENEAEPKLLPNQ
jgi:hypothetical protein